MQTAQDNEALIDIQGLHFARGGKPIFKGVDIRIRQGELTAIMGPSGTGKTTLLRLIGGQLRPDRGQVQVEGREVPGLSRSSLFRLRRRMGMLFQSGALFTDLTCFDNVAFPLRENTRLPERLVRRLVLLKLEAVGLRGAAGLYPAELSGGMARRIALARAIAMDPTLMLYDEPFSGQDPISMGALVQLIRRLNDALGLTSVVVSHDVKEVATIADRIYVLAEGRVIEAGTPAELAASSSPWVRQFMDGLPDGPVPFHYPSDPLADELFAEGRS
jgi:phospholipid/cholesterol/gamma-HCH transport system ATP-binding protein